jgi:hypothetical protein
MLPFIIPIAAYPILKYLAYAGWCGLVSSVYNAEDKLWRTAWSLGFIRLLIGISVGAFVVYTGALASVGGSSGPSLKPGAAAFAFLAAVRWLEWSVMANIVADSAFDAATLVGGINGLRSWQLGGIAVSFATDACAVIAAGNLRGLIC